MARQRKRRFSLKERREQQRLKRMTPLDAVIYLVGVSWSLHYPDRTFPEPGVDTVLDHRVDTEVQRLMDAAHTLGVVIDNKREVAVDAMVVTTTYMDTYELHGRTVPPGGFAGIVLDAIQARRD